MECSTVPESSRRAAHGTAQSGLSHASVARVLPSGESPAAAPRSGFTSAGINCISLRTAERAFWDRTRRRNSETRPNASPGPNLEGVIREIYGTHAPRSHRASDLGLRVYNACKVFWVYTMPASFAQTLWLLSSICSCCCFIFVCCCYKCAR